ncbi:MAG TPA: hypothetical protein VGE66_10630 [Chitinophagaceae bacterium]
MALYIVLFGGTAAVLCGLCAARRSLGRQRQRPWVTTLKTLCTVLLYGLPLTIAVYLLVFKYTVPRPILFTGGALSIVFILLCMNFSAAQKKERDAKRATMLSLLRGYVKARKIEKQVKEWNENYGM